MQRLFSTFPNSWPGAGLLWLRCLLGLAPCAYLLSSTGKSFGWLPLLGYLELLAGVLEAIGLWTPLAASFLAACAALRFFAGYDLSVPRLTLGLANLSLAMLGPGAWSVDARLFGRKRLAVHD